jgi:uncharacterized protein
VGLTTVSDIATSSAPADVVRRQYLASAAGDLEALRATLAPDVEWTEMAGKDQLRHNVGGLTR